MPSLGPSVPITDLKGALAVLGVLEAIVKDPEGVKARVKELTDKIEELGNKRKEVAALADTAAADRRAAEDARDSTAATVVEADTRHAQQDADFKRQVAMLTERTSVLRDREAVLEHDYKEKNSDLNDRETVVRKREADAQAREARNAAETKDLAALRADLEARMAKIKELAA